MLTTTQINLINKINTTDTPEIENEKDIVELRRILTSVVVNGVHSVRVLMTYKKVTTSKKRIQGEDFTGKKGLVKNAVLGQITDVKVSKKGHVYFTVMDENRRTHDKPFGWTSVRLEGIQSVELEGFKKGPKPVKKPRSVIKQEPGKPVENVVIDGSDIDFSVESMGK